MQMIIVKSFLKCTKCVLQIQTFIIFFPTQWETYKRNFLMYKSLSFAEDAPVVDSFKVKSNATEIVF